MQPLNRVCARVPGSDCTPTAADAHSSRHSNVKPPSETTRGVLASALLTMPAHKGHIPLLGGSRSGSSEVVCCTLSVTDRRDVDPAIPTSFRPPGGNFFAKYIHVD